MRQILLTLAIAIGFLYSCDRVEKNSPALQGTLDDGFFKANGITGNETDNGYIVIQGLTQDRIMTLRFQNRDAGATIQLGENSQNIATYQDPLGVVYSTTPGGQGSINITENRTSQKRISGTFNFVAMIPGVDTVVVQKGNFFEAPYGEPTDIDVGDGGNAGNFAATVNGNSFNSVSVSAVASGTSIVIAGVDANNNTILVRVPSDVVNGAYELPIAGFSAAFSEGNTSEQASSGNITIVDHDTANSNIAGTFSFITANNTISQGEFNVSY